MLYIDSHKNSEYNTFYVTLKEEKMDNSEFYQYIKLINNHQNTVALIDIKEFRRLIRFKGEYKWIPFKIGSLPAIPVKTSKFQENFRNTNEFVSIRITPVWSFLTNGEKIITPNIEMFEFKEHSNYNPRYTITRKIGPNQHYFSNTNWQNIPSHILVQPNNAIEWIKKSNATLLTPTDPQILDKFLQIYQPELQQFNELYQESVETTKELKSYQKKIK